MRAGCLQDGKTAGTAADYGANYRNDLRGMRSQDREDRRKKMQLLASACIPIAALGFFAPWVAGAAMALSSVSVVLNALRLQNYSFDNSGACIKSETVTN
jgi:hypothetical protein